MTQHPTKTTIIAFTISLFVFLLSVQFFLHQNPKIASSSALNQTPIHPDPDPIDPYQRAHIIPNPNGTITRLHEFFPTVPPSLSNSSSLSLSKDVPLNPEKHSWVRIFLPSGSGRPAKLPILIFAHGGGFVLYSAASRVFHEFCSNAASRLGALVISVEYRLAPEHRLPAAYDDVLEALSWVKQGKDEWVKERGNFSNCVLAGQSAGANIVYHAGLTASDQVNDLQPLIITGLSLIQPFFGGVDRVGSELRMVNDPFLPLAVSDLMWKLALPEGADRGHEFCDPKEGIGSGNKKDRVRDLGWRVAVVGCDGDPLFDRQVEFVKSLEKNSVNVKSMFVEGGHHGVFSSDPSKEREFFDFVEDFFS